ncbi:DUF885 domain-containing protein [Permianibacter sp. IMCC34836]|uniref:DUF885 domain-containing protein n=1 Tax=Permianibacter fluminis TaxID=2738515 RepID=UPI0015550080|nr:DUF885 domain-containing protein [Permianibacter fluminis]NQD36780.1 DUF885 domain-containing protein [Permianibacter fluminis]
MRHFKKALALSLALALSAPSYADQDWISRSNDQSQKLLNVMAKYSPEGASQLGVDGYDEAITDLSHDQFDESVAEIRGVIAELQKQLAEETDLRIRQDLEILIGSANDQISSSTLNRKYFFPYMDVTGLIFGVVQQTLDPRIPKERQLTLQARLDKYTGMAKGFRPISELAIERTLERIKAEPGLLGPFIGEIEQNQRNAPQLLKGIKDLLATSGLPNWKKSYAALEKQLTAYNKWVDKEILPRARKDHLLPAEVYADNLHQFGVDITPDDLIAKALTSFAEIRNQMTITAGLIAKERKFDDADYRAVMRKLKAEQIPADKVMPLYADRLAQIESAIAANHIVALPDRKAVIRLASPAENAQQPAPHMNPPRLLGNTGEYGEFVLTTAMPPDASGKSKVFDDFTHQAGTWTLTAHEARPGHELQFAKMIETGVSTARAVFAFNSVNVEGWALYAEAEMQPYEPLDGQLFALQARMQRAARAFLDPMVNLGRITPEEVKSFLMNEVGLSEGMATQEMQRYTFRAPGQATSYFYGYQRLMETRQLAQLMLRDKFDRQAFNDFVLAQGLVPPALLRKTVLTDFVPVQLKK